MRPLWLALMLLAAPVSHATQVRDIGNFAGIREVQLKGFGLVTGLQQTGDTQMNRGTAATVIQELQSQGLALNANSMMTRNTALVRLTATMRSDARIGTRVDVRVSSIGDARSLEGGVLETAFLRMPGDRDLTRFLVAAQGPLTVGGFNVEVDGNQSRRNVVNTGTIPGGGIVERELPSAYDYDNLQEIDFLLDADHRGWTTSEQVADAINSSFNAELADPDSAGAVTIAIPQQFRGKFGRFAAKVEQVAVTLAGSARIVINARTGTVVAGGNVTVRPFAIAHGGMKIEVGVDRQASQPGPLATGGQTAIVDNTFIGVDEEEGELVLVNAVSLADLVSALNAMGVKPRDLVVILQAIKDAGALDAELILQ